MHQHLPLLFIVNLADAEIKYSTEGLIGKHLDCRVYYELLDGATQKTYLDLVLLALLTSSK
jgi:hypothetical protein